MNSNLDHIRHSLAHLLAAAVLKKWPDTKLGIGPVIENGFYYDFQFAQPVSNADLKDLEKQMRKMVGGTWRIAGEEIQKNDALALFKDQPFKTELINEYAAEGKTLTIYKTCPPLVDPTTHYSLLTTNCFVDLCKGGHVENTSEIDPDGFKLTKLAGAYWRGDEKNAQLTRIYGIAFENKAALDAYLTMMAEAEKRDHKKLGPELDLFVFSPLVGQGLPLWTPKGTFIRNQLNAFVWSLRKARGYEQVEIPHITKKDLYETSGHWDKYKDDLFKINTREGHVFAMKPMNCPHHAQIYNRKKWSYRELPQRYESTTMVYRDEQSGELAGLSRVRSITQDDAHVFCRMEQAKGEALKIWDIIHEFYGAFGIPLRVRLSTRDPKHPEKYLGDSKRWDIAEKILAEVATEKNTSVGDGVGEAAFYGPKLDFMGKDAIGREHQVATIQVDFNQPERFDLSCVNEKGDTERIVMLHAAIMGSIERFMALLIEHYAGHFPLWLAPKQARVIAVSEKFQDYAKEVFLKLKETGIRAQLAFSDETLGKRIRAAQMEKIPYLLVVGEEEQNAKTIAVKRRSEDLGKLTTADLIARLQKEIADKQ